MSTFDWIGNYLGGMDPKTAPHKRVPDEVKGERAHAQALHILQEQVDEMRLLVATLLRVLVEKEAVREVDLRRVAMEIDLMDGKSDGALRGQVKPDGEVIPDRKHKHK